MGPATTSKDLLNLEQKNPTSSSSLESSLLVCKRNSSLQTSKPDACSGKLVTSSVPKSQVLGKLKDFLGVMAEANTRLEHDSKEKSTTDYDIEVLTGNETEYIEMDLVLGVADLHTPEAVAAAESAMAGSKSVISLPAESDPESSNDDDDDSDCANKVKKSTRDKEVGLNNGRAKKRKKMIELL